MKQVLVCTDGSKYAFEALKYGAWIAEKAGGHLTALYVSDLRQFQLPAVLDLAGSLGIQPYQDSIDILRKVEDEKVKWIRAETEKAMEALGVRSGVFEARSGLLCDVLDEYDRKVDLLVLGKRGEGFEFASEHLGSSLERVLRESALPCWVGNREYREIGNVAFAYDGGKSCREGLRFLTESQWLRDLPFRILVAAEGEGDVGWAQEQAQEAEVTLAGAGYEVETEMLNGVVEDAIANYVSDRGVDLLLMGAYGHSRLRRLIIGSTTSEMLLRCRIPILCFR